MNKYNPHFVFDDNSFEDALKIYRKFKALKKAWIDYNYFSESMKNQLHAQRMCKDCSNESYVELRHELRQELDRLCKIHDDLHKSIYSKEYPWGYFLNDDIKKEFIMELYDIFHEMPLYGGIYDINEDEEIVKDAISKGLLEYYGEGKYRFTNEFRFYHYACTNTKN